MCTIFNKAKEKDTAYYNSLAKVWLNKYHGGSRTCYLAARMIRPIVTSGVCGAVFALATVPPSPTGISAARLWMVRRSVATL